MPYVPNCITSYCTMIYITSFWRGCAAELLTMLPYGNAVGNAWSVVWAYLIRAVKPMEPLLLGAVWLKLPVNVQRIFVTCRS